MKYFLITGTSRGLGAELAKQLLGDNHHVLCIARNENEAVRELAAANKARYEFVPFDLSRIHEVPGMIGDILGKIDAGNAEQIVLINNAAIVTPLGPIEHCSTDEIIVNVNTNMVSQMILAARFIEGLQGTDAAKIILNISSGSGKHPAAGMGVYCSTKAGIEMFTKCVQLEQEHKLNPVQIYSVDPGMMDTGMQQAARRSEQSFPLREFFEEAHKQGKLKTASSVARNIIKKYRLNP